MQSRCCGKKFNWVHTTSIKIFQPYRLHYFSSILEFKFLNGWRLNFRTRDRYGSLPTERRVKVASGFTRGFKPLTGLCDTYRERSIELTNQLEANRQKYFIMSKWLIDLIFSGSYKLIACDIFGHILESCTATKIAAPLSRQIVKWCQTSSKYGQRLLVIKNRL